MTKHTPEDVETMARLLCDATIHSKDGDAWELFRTSARGLLDALQAKGWKIVSRDLLKQIDRPTEWGKQGYEGAYDAAPIVPRNEE